MSSTSDQDLELDPAYEIESSFASEMGFSTFGSQKPVPSKKRKYNPFADAVTSVSPSPTTPVSISKSTFTSTAADTYIPPKRQTMDGGYSFGDNKEEWRTTKRRRDKGNPRGKGRGSGSGSNKIALGFDRMRGESAQFLEVEDGVAGLLGRYGNGKEVGKGEANSRGQGREYVGMAGASAQCEEDGDGEPGYVDGTPPPPDSPRTVRGRLPQGKESQEVAGVAKGDVDGGEKNEEGTEKASDDADGRLDSVNVRNGNGDDDGNGEQLKEEPGQVITAQSREKGPGRVGHEWAALRRGIRNHRGDVAYYDRSFVEDPWKELLDGALG
ncbi:hypothetical protein MMC24_000578 [Lignoscripta atroalba]|nr:hypothetical protein [Lignoscripta atroalba]